MKEITCPMCSQKDSIFIRKNSEVLYKVTPKGAVLDSVVMLDNYEIECGECHAGIHPKELKEIVSDLDNLPDPNERLK